MHAFRANWSETLELMDQELAWIGARGLVVLQLDVQRGRIRRDGLPGAGVVVRFPGVAISFESDRGPLTYRVDTFEARAYDKLSNWQANFRAIALTLRGLRDVTRYGGAELGQQYTGWLALPGGSGGPFESTDQARRWLTETAAHFGVTFEGGEGSWPAIVRRLATKLHPDTSTLEDDTFRETLWQQLAAARKALDL